MAYTPPGSDSADFGLSSGYAAPADNAVDFALGQQIALTPTITIVGTLASVAGGFSLNGEISNGTIQGTTETASGGFVLEHGASLSIAGTTEPILSNIVANRGESLALSGVTEDISGTIDAVRGVACSIPAATLADCSGKIDALMIVYALSGGVKDENSTPLERRVRAYRRSSGELISETDSAPDSGYFDMNVGFEADEFYIAAVDLDPEAVDFTPSITNRVESVLRYD